MKRLKRAEPHSGNCNGSYRSCSGRTTKIIQHDYEFGALACGILTALMFGACVIQWAVM